MVIPEQPLQASEAKWLISKLDWFAGSRMHATIGALSSGTPAAALAYSGKTQGVFETAGEGASVLDLRVSKTNAQVIARAMSLFKGHAASAGRLKLIAARLRLRADEQMDAIASFIRTPTRAHEAA